MLAWISSTLGRMICSANEACSVMCCLLLVPPLAPEEAVLGRRPALLLLGALVAQVLLDHAPAGADVFPTVVRHPEPPWPPATSSTVLESYSWPSRCSFRLVCFHQRLCSVVVLLRPRPERPGQVREVVAPEEAVLLPSADVVPADALHVEGLEFVGIY